jgi:predicted nucleic acid-binding protein
VTDWQVVDSSGWLEYFAGSDRAHLFAPAIEQTERLLVPLISIYEVFKTALRQQGEREALTMVHAMRTGRVIGMGFSLLIKAAHHSLPLADSIIYATTIKYGATLWTQDAHFNEMPSVKYIPKPAANPIR